MGLPTAQFIFCFCMVPAGTTNIAPTRIEFPPDTKAVAGEKLSLNCTYSTSSRYHYLYWYKDDQVIPPILEDPNCEGLNKTCKTDSRYSKDHEKRKSNIRSYMYIQQFCLQDYVHMHADLVIDKVGPDDAGSYTCKLFNFSSTDPLDYANLTVQVGESTWWSHGNTTDAMVTKTTATYICMYSQYATCTPLKLFINTSCHWSVV